MPATPEQVQGVWTLIEHGKYKLLDKLAPDDFDWHSLCPTNHYTVCHALLDHFIQHGSSSSGDGEVDGEFGKYSDWVLAAKVLVQRGASPLQLASAKCTSFSKFSYDEEKGEETEKFKYASKSAIDVACEMQENFRALVKDDKGDWDGEIEKIDILLKVFEGATLSSFGFDRVSVADDAVSQWERILNDKSSTDIILKCKSGKTVSAHTWMLKTASHVLSAMLSVGMAEKQSKCIDVSDTQEASVKLFLEACYCGCVKAQKRDWKIVLECLDLAHRWQVDFIVMMMQKLLVPLVSNASFDGLCEAASLKDLSVLKTALKEFGTTNKVIKGRFEKGEIPEACLPYVAHARKSTGEPARKKVKRVC